MACTSRSDPEHGPGWHGELDKMLTAMETAGLSKTSDGMRSVQLNF